MAFLQCSFHSDVLGMGCQMNVIVPQIAKTEIGITSAKSKRKKYKLLYLLHGCSDDHTIWGRRTSIERYVAGQDLVVVMPCVHRSYYTDMKGGGKYWTFISAELPAIVEDMFPVSTKREDTFVAGLSMGGYGTLKLLFNQPERFAGGAALSAVTYMDIIRGWRPDEWRQIFGTPKQFAGTINDLETAAAKLAKSGVAVPKIFQCCGTEDFLYQDNLKFRDYLKSLKLAAEYREYPGEHNWYFWDAHIVEALRAIGAIA